MRGPVDGDAEWWLGGDEEEVGNLLGKEDFLGVEEAIGFTLDDVVDMRSGDGCEEAVGQCSTGTILSLSIQVWCG